MGRRTKAVVDYFPHYVSYGKTLFVLQSKYGNDGYACWFKILEMLGSSDGHFIDCRRDDDWEFLLAKMCVTDETANKILDLLSALEAIDAEMWSSRIIYSQNFTENISDVYKRRIIDLPSRDDICKQLSISLGDKCKQKNPYTGIDDVGNTQTKLKETRGNSLFEQFWEVWPKKIDKAKCKQWWERNKPDGGLVDLMIQNIEAMKKTAQWEDPQYIPGPYRWLYGRRWEDEIPESEEEEPDITFIHETLTEEQLREREHYGES